MEISNFRIPYDVDILWDGGCGSDDWWGDGYGERVNLLISDSGSAYLCPEGDREDWRIYVTPQGSAWRLPMVPDGYGSSEDPPWEADSKYGDILACGISTVPGLEEALLELYGESRAAPARGLAVAFSGTEIDLRNGWSLAFDGAEMSLSTNRGRQTSINVSGASLITHARTTEECRAVPSEWFLYDIRCEDVRRTEVPDVNRARSKFERILDASLQTATPYARMVIIAARALFEAGARATAEIWEFEATCRSMED